jgi:nicotinate phosphoribosyltransferase
VQDLALFTDLYELTMLQAYFEEEMVEQAVFSLFVRRLPPGRNFLIACGLGPLLEYLERLSFSDDDIAYLESLGGFRQTFLRRLRDLQFTGDVRAVPEGTPVFANEPILEVAAPLPQAQLIETLVMNQTHVHTVLASKAERVVAAARGKPVIDFGARRTHGFDAAMKAARAFHIAGVAATSNVLAGKRYGVPLSGTMAHSYIQAHKDEATAFASFAGLYPETVLLVDTYDTMGGVQKVIDLARQLGEAFRVRAVRLDSGDLAALAIEARRALDEAGLERVEVFASGGLDERRIASLLDAGAPIDGFGVGSSMAVSDDAPVLDIAYKLCEYAGLGRLKLSSGKPVLPGRKQVFRVGEDGVDTRDTIARAGEELPGRPLLEPMMQGGRRLSAACVELEASRRHAKEMIGRLPPHVRGLDAAEPPYPVDVSRELREYQADVGSRLAHGGQTR